MDWFDFPVSHGYITQYEGPNTDTPHWADDIATPFHTPITALLPGTVVQADYQSWGGEIFIKPDDTRYPEYYIYHPDLLETSVGQHVQAGQEIALSGGENPGYPGALHPSSTAMSSGSHTHVGWFTGWRSTPIGTRPFGPDFTPMLNDIKAGKIVVPPDTGSAGETTKTAATVGNWTATGQSGLVRIGLFIMALMFLGFGIYLLFPNQIDGAARKVGKAVEMAAFL